MNIAYLDICDSNLQLWHRDTHLQSPGYALLEGGEYRFGTAARAAARLQPRNINTRYWWQLSTETLQPALGPARHAGDLVHAHLQALHREGGQPEEMLLAVSGSMQREQLALLLGIIQQCPFDAVGLVHRSVALGSLCGDAARVFHLEVQLHQAVVSELERTGEQMALRRSTPLPGCGLLQLQERLVELIAGAFIRQTRFDPRRKAATEQQLYDALPAALRALGSAVETNIEVSGYRARISAGELQPAGQHLFDSVPQATGVLGDGDRLVADPVAALLPGLARHLPHLELLPADSLPRALQRHQSQVVQRERALSFVTTLPCQGPASADATSIPVAAPAPSPARREPTHLLCGALARPLRAAGTALQPGWELRRADAGWELQGRGATAQVNGVDYRPGQLLACGDSITIAGGTPVVLIEVESS